MGGACEIVLMALHLHGLAHLNGNTGFGCAHLLIRFSVTKKRVRLHPLRSAIALGFGRTSGDLGGPAGQ